MADAAPEALRGAADSVERQLEVPPKLALGVRAPVGEPLLRELPDAFVGVELRGVAREAIEVEPGKGTTQGTDRVAFVDAAVVPDEDHRPSEMAKQMPDEGADLGMLNVLGVEAVVQSEAAPAGSHRDSGNDGDPIAPLAVVEERRLSARGPGLADTGDQEEARLVDEDEMGAQPSSVFFTRGHCFRFHSSILRSSRSIARRSGFW